MDAILTPGAVVDFPEAPGFPATVAAYVRQEPGNPEPTWLVIDCPSDPGEPWLADFLMRADCTLLGHVDVSKVAELDLIHQAVGGGVGVAHRMLAEACREVAGGWRCEVAA